MKPIIEPFKLSLRQVSEATNESLPVIYDAVKAGHLASFLCGRRRFFRPAAVRAWVDFLEARSQAGHPVSYRARSADLLVKR